MKSGKRAYDPITSDSIIFDFIRTTKISEGEFLSSGET